MPAEALPKTPTEELKALMTEIRSGQTDAKAKALEQESKWKMEFDALAEKYTEQKSALDLLRKASLKYETHAKANIRPGFLVDDECAKYFGALLVCAGSAQKKLGNSKSADRLEGMARESLGIESKSALTSSDIVLPTNFASQIVELYYKFGQARQWATIFPISANQTKLPKTTTSPAFSFMNASATVPEKSPQFAFATFTPQKAGGLIRMPSEIEEDTLPVLGDFLARYIAREMARWEDNVLFIADGTGGYGSISGVGKTADTLGNKVQLVTTKTHVTDIAIADMRLLRSKIDAAALGTACYYMHPSMEAYLSSFNTSTYVPYVAFGPNGPTFEGFPIRWVGVMPIYDVAVHLSQYQVYFGDLSYWYLGDRRSMDVQVSRDVFFATDEIAMRALERFDVQLLANNSMAVLQLAAS